MIQNKLIPLLKQKFGANSFSEGTPPNPIAIFPAVHADVGPLRILEDGPEIIVEIGDITHGHFASYQPSDMSDQKTPEQLEREVIESVIDFLDDLFAGNYILWRSKRGAGGGWHGIDYHDTNDPQSYIQEDAIFFTWAGPLHPNSN